MNNNRHSTTAVRPAAVISIILFALTLVHTVGSAQIIAAGNYYSLVLCKDGTVRTWGSNVSGQLGDSTFDDKNTPVLVKGLSGIIAVAGEGNHSIALKSDSTVWCWGFNTHGELGDESFNNKRNLPVKAVGLSGVIAIAAGENHCLALRKDSTVWAWGWGYYGQLGNGMGMSTIPAKIDSISGVIAIAAGSFHSLALKKNGTVWAWGNNSSGELGIENESPSDYPRQVSGLTGVTSISGSAGNSFAIKNDGTVWVWGNNTYFQLGNNTEAFATFPRQVNGLSGITVMTGGFQHSIALKNDGTVWTWGNNSAGQLGIGVKDSNDLYEYHPTKVKNLTGVVAVTGGGTHTLAVKSDGSVWAWGYNYNGQLGNGTNIENNTLPLKVSGTWQALTSVARSSALPEGFSLSQNYPNPFNPSTNINYQLANNSFVTLKVYDAIGREVAALVNESKDAGTYSVQFNGSNVSSGMYFYTLRAGAFTATKKLILLK
ncbi:MAG: T9SS type A sorting domain-containing protein [Bacteroidota bacterium]